MKKIFKKISKKKIFIIATVVVLLIVSVLILKPLEKSEPKSISEEELGEVMMDIYQDLFKDRDPVLNDITPKEELYNNEYTKAIRVELDKYLAGNKDIEAIEPADFEDLTCGLGRFDKEYYKSKFLIVSVKNQPAGGIDFYIFFIDKPDKIFNSWIFKLGSEELSLRAFCEKKLEGIDQEFLEEVLKEIIQEDQDFAL